MEDYQKLTTTESEIGRICFLAYGKLAHGLKPKERLQSLSFTEAMAYLCTKLCYRDATNTMKRFLHRDSPDHIKLRTLSDSMQRIGSEISDVLVQSTERILKMYGFHPETGILEKNITLSPNVMSPAQQGDPAFPVEKIQDTVDAINESREENALQIFQESASYSNDPLQ